MARTHYNYKFERLRLADHQYGFTLIMLLISVAIALILSISMMVHYMPYMRVTQAINEKNKPKEIIVRTSVEIKWAQAKQKPIDQLTPYEDQPLLERPMLFVAQVKEGDNAGRGSLELIMDPAGFLRGQWSGTYNLEPENIKHDIMLAEFAGLTDPDELYKDDDGEDQSKLFFIGRGDFSIVARSTKGDKASHVIGEIYITGWLQKDYRASGQLHLISKERDHWVYKWTSEIGEYIE